MSLCLTPISFHPVLRIVPTDIILFDGREFFIEDVRHDISADGLSVYITDRATMKARQVPIRSLAIWKTNRFIPVDTVHSPADMTPIPLRTRSESKKNKRPVSMDEAPIPLRTRSRKNQQQTPLYCAPSSVVSTCVGTVNTSDQSYKRRKMKQNDELIEDTFTYLRKTGSASLGPVKVLALDDFTDLHDGKRRLSTLCSYMMHGGRKSNFYVINPQPDIFREVYNRGGYGIPLLVRDALAKPYIRFPRFDVIYLDYTSKFRTIEPDIALLMERNDQLLKSKAILHLTVSKRGVGLHDYQKEIARYIDKIIHYARPHGIHVDVIRQYDSPKMFKIDVLLRKERRSSNP